MLERHKFVDLYEMSSGISTKPEQAGHGSPFVSFRTVFNNHFLPDELPDMMHTSASEQETYSVQKGDILLTRTSETIDELGMSCVALKDYPGATYSGFAKRLRPRRTGVVDERFIGFYLRSELFRKTMTNNAVMTLRASLNEEIFSYLELILPDYPTQKRIGEVLYSLNQKITLNQRINAVLEAMAKLLYDYWFVQFDFPMSAAQAKRLGKPNLEGKPYKSSGGPMVYNAELKRGVPEGWEVTELRKYLKSNRGLSYTSADIGGEGRPMINLNSFTPKGTYKVDGLKLYSGPVNPSKVLQPYDLLMCNTQQTALDPAKDIIGKSLLVPDIFDEEILSSADVTTISAAKENLKYYLNSLFNSEYFHRYISGYCSGSNILHLNLEGVLSFRTAIPDDGLLERFGTFIQSIEQRKNVTLKENQELASLRDWLLPLLMNGQVRVSAPLDVTPAEEKVGLAMAAEGAGGV